VLALELLLGPALETVLSSGQEGLLPRPCGALPSIA
jgi:hypothetical protein